MTESTDLDRDTNGDDWRPPVDGPPGRITGIGLSIGILALGLGMLIAFLTPRFRGVFVDFDTALPSMTLAFMQPPGWIWPALLTIIALLVVLKDLVLARRNCRRINYAVSIGVVLLLGVYFLSMFLPLINLIQGVSA